MKAGGINHQEQTKKQAAPGGSFVSGGHDLTHPYRQRDFNTFGPQGDSLEGPIIRLNHPPRSADNFFQGSQKTIQIIVADIAHSGNPEHFTGQGTLPSIDHKSTQF
jgi:hypothetical protein